MSWVKEGPDLHDLGKGGDHDFSTSIPWIVLGVGFLDLHVSVEEGPYLHDLGERGDLNFPTSIPRANLGVKFPDLHASGVGGG